MGTAGVGKPGDFHCGDPGPGLGLPCVWVCWEGRARSALDKPVTESKSGCSNGQDLGLRTETARLSVPQDGCECVCV